MRQLKYTGPVVHVEALVEWLNPETRRREVVVRPIRSCDAAELVTEA